MARDSRLKSKALRDEGIALFNAGRHEDAAGRFEAAAAGDPSDASTLTFLAHCHCALGREAEAIRVLLRAPEATAEDPEVMRLLARLLRSAGRGAEAERLEKAADAAQPAAALLAEGRDFAASGRRAEAETRLARSIELDRECMEAHLLLGRIRSDDGRLAEAEASFRRALELAPRSYELRFRLGELCEKLSRPGEAAKFYEEASRLSPGSFDAALRGGMLRLAEGKPEEAELLIRAARASGCPKADGFLALGAAFEERGDLDKAEGLLKTALEVDAGSADSRYRMGELLARRGRMDEAEARIAEAVELSPSSFELRMRLGDLRERRFRIVEAAETFSEAARLFPASYEPPLRLALLAVESGRLDQAETHLEAARAAGCREARGWLALAEARAARGGAEAAARLFAQAVEIEPGSVRARLLAAESDLRRGRLDEAAAGAKAAAALDPSSPKPHILMAKVFEERGVPAGSEAAYRDAVAAAPADLEARLTLGDHLLKTLELEAAERELRAAVELDPKAPEGHLLLGKALEARGRPGAARESRARAEGLFPRLPWGALLLGEHRLDAGDLDAAEPDLFEAARLSPRLPEARLLLGRLHEKRGRLAEAEEEYRAAAALAPRSREALSALGWVSVKRGGLARAEENIDPRVELFEKGRQEWVGGRFDENDLLLHWWKWKERASWTLDEIKAMWAGLAAEIRAGRAPEALNLFVEIPFCRAACAFCNFYKEIAQPDSVMAAYLDRLTAECERLGSALDGLAFRNMFVGGGSPSVLSAAQIRALLATIGRTFRFGGEGERTYECFPASLDEEKIAVIREGGINRVSIGVQSLTEKTLSAVGREFQSPPRVLEVIRMIRAADFERGMNVDLIIGLEHDTPERLLKSIEILAAEGPEAFTLYSLTPHSPYLRRFYPEDSAPFFTRGRRFEDAVHEGLAKNAARWGYEMIDTRDELGLEKKGSARFSRDSDHYEDISHVPFSLLGLGARPRSFVYGRGQYHAKTTAFDAFDPGRSAYAGERLDRTDMMLRVVLYGLRNRSEVSLPGFERLFGAPLDRVFPRAFKDLVTAGYLKVSGDRLLFAGAGARERFLTAVAFVGENPA